MGIGIGLMIMSLIIILFPSMFFSDYEVEKKAREMGMKYPDEIRALENVDLGGSEE